jgi:hypothetical protein
MCECGNKDHFIESAITTWEVDHEGERILKIKEDSKFCCPVCGQIVTPFEEEMSPVS